MVSIPRADNGQLYQLDKLVKVMLMTVKNNSDKVQVELLNSLQETCPLHRQDVGILPYKQLDAQHFYDPISSLLLLKGSKFYSMSLPAMFRWSSSVPSLGRRALPASQVRKHGQRGSNLNKNEYSTSEKQLKPKFLCVFLGFFCHKMKFIKYFCEL